MDCFRNTIGAAGFRIMRELDEGSFGFVCHAIDSPNGIVRCLSEHQMFTIKAKLTADCLEGELELWATLRHPHIVPLLRTVRTPRVTLFLMPRMLGETMQDAVLDPSFRARRDAFEMSLKWLGQALSAIEYLHGRGIAHTAVRSNKILLRRTESGDPEAVLCDFGLATQTGKRLRRAGLPLRWKPPEAFGPDSDSLPEEGASYDIWAFGILCLTVWDKSWLLKKFKRIDSWTETVYPKIFKRLQPERFRKSLREAFPMSRVTAKTADLALNLVRSTLRYSPAWRPCARQVASHPIFSDPDEGLPLFPEPIWSVKVRSFEGVLCEAAAIADCPEQQPLPEDLPRADDSHEAEGRPADAGEKVGVDAEVNVNLDPMPASADQLLGVSDVHGDLFASGKELPDTSPTADDDHEDDIPLDVDCLVVAILLDDLAQNVARKVKHQNKPAPETTPYIVENREVAETLKYPVSRSNARTKSTDNLLPRNTSDSSKSSSSSPSLQSDLPSTRENENSTDNLLRRNNPGLMKRFRKLVSKKWKKFKP